MIVNTVIARRNEKLRDKSQKIHFNRTASNSISIELIQTKAVKNSNNKICVRGNAVTCRPALRINSNRLQHMADEKPRSRS